jgi:hypothetical protein
VLPAVARADPSSRGPATDVCPNIGFEIARARCIAPKAEARQPLFGYAAPAAGADPAPEAWLRMLVPRQRRPRVLRPGVSTRTTLTSAVANLLKAASMQRGCSAESRPPSSRPARFTVRTRVDPSRSWLHQHRLLWWWYGPAH